MFFIDCNKEYIIYRRPHTILVWRNFHKKKKNVNEKKNNSYTHYDADLENFQINHGEKHSALLTGFYVIENPGKVIPLRFLGPRSFNNPKKS